MRTPTTWPRSRRPLTWPMRQWLARPSLKGSLHGTIRSPRGEGQLTARNVSAYGVAVGPVTARLRLDQGRAHVDADVPDLEARVTGAVDTTRTVRFSSGDRPRSVASVDAVVGAADEAPRSGRNHRGHGARQGRHRAADRHRRGSRAARARCDRGRGADRARHARGRLVRTERAFVDSPARPRGTRDSRPPGGHALRERRADRDRRPG